MFLQLEKFLVKIEAFAKPPRRLRSETSFRVRQNFLKMLRHLLKHLQCRDPPWPRLPTSPKATSDETADSSPRSGVEYRHYIHSNTKVSSEGRSPDAGLPFLRAQADGLVHGKYLRYLPG